MWGRLGERTKLGLGVGCVVAAFGLGFAARPVAGRPEPSVPATPAAVVIEEPTPAPTVTPAELIVHVAGAVRNPGVYTFREGQRVRDAIEAAGGATADGDPGALNLAAPLKDGQRIAVSQRTSTRQAGAVAATPTAGPLNVNTASQAELEALPGIGKVTAERIVRYREESGSFTSIEDLRTLKLVNSATLEKLRGLLVAD